MRMTTKRLDGACVAAAFITFITLTLYPTAARAQQWTTSTNSTSNISTAGSVNNVGVGTMSPAYGLDVEGQSTTSNNFAQGYFKNTSTAYPYGGVAVDGQSQSHVRFMLGGALKWQWRAGGAAGTDDLRAFSWTLGRDVLTMTYGGNVGIGTTSPANALHVNNDFGPGMMRVSGVSLGLINIADTAAPADRKIYQLRSESGLFRLSLINDGLTGFVVPNVLVANSTGNVGIGTASPGGQLSVSGTSAAGGSVEAHILNSTSTGYQSLRFGTDSVAQSSLYLNAFNASWTTSGANVADGGSMFGAGSGGLSVGAGNDSGVLRLYTGGTGSANERVRIDAAGNVGIGTQNPSAKLDVQGGVSVNGDITATGNIAAKYQDVAEWVPSTQKLRAGTVVVLDTDQTNHVVASTKSYDTGVAGVISDSPGVILGVSGEGKLKVATTGRVRVKVDATHSPIHVGDLLVTSDTEGVAMKSVEVDLGGVKIHRPGTIIGKALEPLASGTGEILVLLSLQ